mmetsp:Transcript_20649/g.43399  ORF Transcript_20649/g.43399 Transcript_20649/m.43399 type:complete len:811 (-) Transcript_20649:77-2509(-)
MSSEGPNDVLWLAAKGLLLLYFCSSAYHIRCHAINEYGPIIHEFDPWFNMRATQYLADNGWTEFFHWFDHRSWYPLGRPVGTTIYPGMQITSVCIWKALEWFGISMSLNDVCVYIPTWFGVLATLFLGLLTKECSGSANAGLAAAGVMSIIPAHIMRSVGGGYDNESVAVTAMCSTFFFWVRSLRNENSWLYGAAAGLAYIYMVAAWGGYVFVLNMVGVHTIFLVFLGRHSTKLHRAYTLFYIIGTAGAIQVPVVGWTPLKSLEQLGPFGVLIVLQVMEYCEIQRRKKDLTDQEVGVLRVKVALGTLAAGAAAAFVLLPTGYFGPLSSRVRGLFVQHTKTGNPLVDSVAEHQPARPEAYWHYLHYMCYFSPIGFLMCCFRRTDAKYFLVFYAVIAYFFSLKMVRLIILTGPIASALGGMAIAAIVEGALSQLNPKFVIADEDEDEAPAAASSSKGGSGKGAAPAAGKGGDKKAAGKAGVRSKRRAAPPVFGLPDDPLDLLPEEVKTEWSELYASPFGKTLRFAVSAFVLVAGFFAFRTFSAYSHQMAVGMSNPSIVFRARLQNGQEVLINDYLDAYHWLRNSTPYDSRVMAWWDYGYQIAGIGNRTTIADGNTWNHEHIATLGKCLTSEESKAHAIVRHLADYVLVWTGGGGDDLAKSPHMARIGNSVYSDICPDDPLCRHFGFNKDGSPTPTMAVSLLYKLHAHNQQGPVQVNSTLFKEVFTSRYNMVRIYKVRKVSKKSKKWLADPANRICDAPGSWYCNGQYPPAMAKLIAKRKSFKQLEDFNKEGQTAQDLEYQRKYMQGMNQGPA